LVEKPMPRTTPPQTKTTPGIKRLGLSVRRSVVKGTSRIT
jgi:hypothetical protein